MKAKLEMVLNRFNSITGRAGYFAVVCWFGISRFIATADAAPFRVFIDPGHGGKDWGARGFFSLTEKEVALKLGLHLKRALVKASASNALPLEVVLSRESDRYLSLRDRVDGANRANADLFLSLHANASNAREAKGFEVYFASPNSSDAHVRELVKLENSSLDDRVVTPLVLSILSDAQASYHVMESSHLAETIFQRMSQKIRPHSQGVRQGPFKVLSATAMPAILIEVGYITNVEEALLLSKDSYLWQVSSVISAGILEVQSRRLKRLKELTP